MKFSMDNKLVSIVLPVYNGERFLSESIDSIIAQTYQNWELIIIDDCSSDNTPAIAKEYADKDNRIRYYRNETNLKLPKGLNRGFSLAKGNYFTWTSDDNRFLPNAIKVMLDTLIMEQVDLVYASYDIIDENNKTIGENIALSDPKRAILKWNCVGACFLYTRKVYETIGEYNPDLFLVEDYEYWIRVISKFEAKEVVDKLYEYRTHSENLSNIYKKSLINERCEDMLLSNIYRYGKLDITQKYYLYSQLNTLRECKKDKKERKKYSSKAKIYKCLYLISTHLEKKY